ncbi:DUF4400 domain-containing protein [Azospirillum sp. SYSU D00513]|uniref:DUF4400 domain-containing protein n=1 Tax=Azospirillum sp. SYSU D00513 TaxID=2812561 RepID=UPI001A975038|nr:DUF4400 domain-containing protein [Azospirillum sp. SYSU D00513]
MAAENNGRGLMNWFFWFVLSEFVVILVITPLLGRNWIDQLITWEREFSLAQVGFDTTLWIERTGWSMYAWIFRDFGLEKSVYEFFLPSHQQAAASRGLEALGAKWYFPLVQAGLDSLFGSIQRFFVRLAMIGAWLPVLPLMLVPAILHGMMAWRSRQYTFDYASPLVHGMAAKAAIWIVIGTPMILMLPVPIPPLIFPVFFLLLSLTLLLVTKHTMKRI